MLGYGGLTYTLHDSKPCLLIFAYLALKWRIIIGRKDHSHQRKCRLTVFSPFIFTPNGSLLLWSEVVDDIKRSSNFLGRPSPDHFSNHLAASVKQGLDVEVVCRQNNFV
ncbi:hypothetical protein NG271_595 [Saccharomyces cerevisiae synthetic construct]|uniref:Putative uncharacterized protein YDR327W n=2 Tax=Saccharomyces cerevisiae TaxID=4932 RepID=YD327_YEAST|nr:RecName: Full=Putative uncharacterized protein YDR327W [Saccharomyces cerevisiae S288C]AAB64768.1 Ydr327wp [Saccharomyces cerevisiae]WNF20148.1 hypothetical protein NG271_595 [Saccharomyces cerevisiae synthetic construct]CAY78829.1 EC1118_1D0_6161p [Saccharomyces cerevisiae EC1118]